MNKYSDFDVMEYRGQYYYRSRLNQILINPNYKVFLVRKEEQKWNVLAAILIILRLFIRKVMFKKFV